MTPAAATLLQLLVAEIAAESAADFQNPEMRTPLEVQSGGALDEQEAKRFGPRENYSRVR